MTSVRTHRPAGIAFVLTLMSALVIAVGSGSIARADNCNPDSPNVPNCVAAADDLVPAVQPAGAVPYEDSLSLQLSANLPVTGISADEALPLVSGVAAGDTGHCAGFDGYYWMRWAWAKNGSWFKYINASTEVYSHCGHYINEAHASLYHGTASNTQTDNPRWSSYSDPCAGTGDVHDNPAFTCGSPHESSKRHDQWYLTAGYYHDEGTTVKNDPHDSRCDGCLDRQFVEP